MPWKKGQSGNPGGRPKELEGIRQLARENAPLAIETLVDVATKGKSESARVAASTALLDRGFGKPAKDIAVEEHRSIRDMTTEELLAIASGGIVYRDQAEQIEGPVIEPTEIDKALVNADGEAA